MTISPGVPMTADSTDRRDELARAVADIIRAEVREALAMPDGEFWPSFAADKAAVAVIDHLHAAGRMYAPPLIDREDRDELIEVMRWAIEGETSWTGSVALYPIIADAIIATGWLRATGPARDEGLRAAYLAGRDAMAEAVFKGYAAPTPGDADEWVRAALAASPAPGGDTGATASNWQPMDDPYNRAAPGGDTAPREDELHRPFTDDGVKYCGWDGYEGCGEVWPCAHERARRAARPVPPGPAATRDGETGG